MARRRCCATEFETNHVSQATAALCVPTHVSVTDTHLIIEGKLEEMGHDSRNVQVVVQGEDEGSPLYLVSDASIIKNIGGVEIASDLQVETHDTIESLHSALCEARSELQSVVDNKATELAELQRLSSEETARLHVALLKVEQKATRFWKLRCEQMLVHGGER